VTAKKAKKKAGHLWRWFDVVEELVQADEHLPVKRHAVLVVAFLRAGHADPDGANSWPSREKMAQRAQLKPETVLTADRWLEAQGLMEYVRTTYQQVKVYRLTFPPAAPHASLGREQAEDVLPPEGVNTAAPVASHVASHVASLGGDDLLPPNVSEEEEEGPTAGPDGPPPTFTSKELAQARKLLRRFVHAGHDLDASALEPVVAEYLATVAAGWAEATAYHRCGVILAKATSNPTAYLRNGLRRDGHLGKVPLPAWAQALNAWERLVADFEAVWDQLADDETLDRVAAMRDDLEEEALAVVGLEWSGDHVLGSVLDGTDRRAADLPPPPPVERLEELGRFVKSWRKEHLPELEALVAEVVPDVA
jgi:hypothetical protein